MYDDINRGTRDVGLHPKQIEGLRILVKEFPETCLQFPKFPTHLSIKLLRVADLFREALL
jgi:hypothetical protein